MAKYLKVKQADNIDESPKPIPDGDYILRDGRAWIELHGLAIRIRSDEVNKVVYFDVFRNGDEMGELIDKMVTHWIE